MLAVPEVYVRNVTTRFANLFQGLGTDIADNFTSAWRQGLSKDPEEYVGYIVKKINGMDVIVSLVFY
jgi:hypothetical protein